MWRNTACTQRALPHAHMSKKGTEDGWQLSRQVGRDMHSGVFVEAVCPHGVGHHKGVHGCDGCCANPPAPIWAQVTVDEPTPPRAHEVPSNSVPSPITYFNLLIDEQRCHVLNALHNLLMDKGAEMMMYLAKGNLAGVCAEMFEEIKDKEHKNKWCQDPNCEYDKPNDNEQRED